MPITVQSVQIDGVVPDGIATVIFKLDNGDWETVTIDQTPVVVPPPSDLYRITEESWRKVRKLPHPPDGGPYTIALATQRASGRVVPGDNIIAVGRSVQNWIRSFNPDPNSWTFYVNYKGGPTKGIDAVTGMMRYLGLAFPGPGNVVKLMRDENGNLDVHTNDGIDWARMDTTPIDSFTGITPTTHPWRFGRIITGSIEHIVTCPYMNVPGKPFWIDMSYVTRIT